MNDWIGMPEFVQHKIKAFRVVNFLIGDRKIITRFNSQADVDAFTFHNNINLPDGYKDFTLNNNESIRLLASPEALGQ